LRKRGNYSAAFIAAGTAALRRFHATRHLRQMCGAKRKRDGLPCQGAPMQNGRCWYHGGRTPKGDRWHTPVWPKASAPMSKLERKLRDRERLSGERSRRLAAMSPAERAAYDAWERAHRVGSNAQREQLRRDRHGAAEMRARLGNGRNDQSAPDADLLAAEADRLERELRSLEAEALGIGVFG
jgi:hypothetical protein